MRISCFIIDVNEKEDLCYKPFSFLTELVNTYEASCFYVDCTDVTFIDGEVVSICVPFGQFNELMNPERKFTQKHGIGWI